MVALNLSRASAFFAITDHCQPAEPTTISPPLRHARATNSPTSSATQSLAARSSNSQLLRSTATIHRLAQPSEPSSKAIFQNRRARATPVPRATPLQPQRHTHHVTQFHGPHCHPPHHHGLLRCHLPFSAQSSILSPFRPPGLSHQFRARWRLAPSQIKAASHHATHRAALYAAQHTTC